MEECGGVGPHQDRLSSLPDYLLIHILSFLPIESSATTSTLSHRWSNLWTHPTHLSFNHRHFPPSPDRDFLTTVAHILSQLSSPKLHSFTLFLRQTTQQPCFSYLSSWVPLICSKQVEELEIGIDHSVALLIPIPTCVFQCGSLVKLKLYAKSVCKPFCRLPDDGIINLPNLKVLHLSKIQLDPHLVGVLFKSCPLLERRTFMPYLETQDIVVEIFAPNFNYLCVHSESKQMKFVIDAPKLEEIWITGRLATYSFVQKPVGLLRAEFLIFGDSGGNDYHRRVLEIFRGISSVKSIKLYGGFDIFDSLNYVHNDGRIVFPNLAELIMNGILKDHFNWDAQIPTYLLAQLKSLHFERFSGDDTDMKLIEYFLMNGNALEKMYVDVKYLFGDDIDDERERDQLWKEFRFCRELFTLPKISPTYKVEFIGNYIRGSSDGFKDGFQDGLLASQINISRWRQS